MKFYNREREIELLKKIIEGKGTRIVVVKGLRRIGKTRTILEVLKKKYAYIFVPKDKSTSIFLEEMSEDLKIPLFRRLRDFLIYLFDKYEFVFFDEFQNFYYMDKSVYSDLQKLIDKFKRENKNICIFFAGSSYSLINKIFTEYSKALYGRRDIEITLDELPVKSVFEILEDLGIKNIEEKVMIYSMFGGIPKFYEIIESASFKTFKEIIKLLFENNFRTLLDEGNTILKSEFGGEYKTYYTILEAISFGKTRLNEIASVFDNNINAANRYLAILRKDYNLIARIEPLIKQKQKEGIYAIKNIFFMFWFRFIKRCEALYEQGRVNEIIEIFKNNFNSYVGKIFERIWYELILEGHAKLPFPFTKIGRQWGKVADKPKGENSYEIDIVALNEKTKEILFGECKWQNKVNALKIAKELAEKSRYVPWHNGERKETFAIFAKSFTKRIEEFEGRKVYCYDLKDLKKFLIL